MARDTDEMIDEVEKEIFQITEKRITSDYKPIDVIIDHTLKDIIKWHNTKSLVTGIGSGYPDIDDKLTGFHGSELIIIAARPGMGKTALALNIMNHVALEGKETGPLPLHGDAGHPARHADALHRVNDRFPAGADRHTSGENCDSSSRVAGKTSQVAHVH